MRKQFLFETPLGLWLRAEYFCMVSPVKHCCTPIHGLNDKSVEVCCAFTFFPWLLWQMGVSQVHAVCLTFPYLSKNNIQLQFLLCYCSQAVKAFFSNNLYSVSGPTNQLGVFCGHLRANGSLCMDGGSGCGSCWSSLCSCLASCQGRDTCAWAFRRQKFCFVFRFFFVASVWYRLRKPKVNAHRAVNLSGSSCLASTELVSCGKACFADQNHNWTLYFWQHWCLALSKQLWMKYLGVGINIFRLP